MVEKVRLPALALGLVLGLLTAPATAPTSAEAATISISIGTNLSSGRSITCIDGERRLRARGFRNVRRVNCRGRFFVYRAWRGSNWFEIAVRQSNGRIVDVRRIRR
jgi:hypothetical protein